MQRSPALAQIQEIGMVQDNCSQNERGCYTKHMHLDEQGAGRVKIGETDPQISTNLIFGSRQPLEW